MTDAYITLREALESGRLAQFASQEEVRGVGPINRAAFDAGLSKLVKAKRPEDRTSHSASGGNSTGTEIRRDTDQGASR
jgi:hypothetical protein